MMFVFNSWILFLSGDNDWILEEFMRAENGWLEILSSMGRLTEGMGTLEIPLS